MFHFRDGQPTICLVMRCSDPLRLLFQDQGKALANAAGLLAGPAGRRLVINISDRLAADAPIGRQTRRKLRELLGILSLENVEDDSRIEAKHFARINPASPVVEKICLLTDALRRSLEALDG